MDARISAGILLICLGLRASAGGGLAALTADDALACGRARLFDGTVSGPARACDVFAAGLAAASKAGPAGSRELLFLHALARTTVLLGNPNDAAVPDEVLRWVERLSTASVVGSVEILPSRLPPGPSAVAQIDEIIAELGSIEDRPSPFVMHLRPDEMGLMHEIEIDYGEVLMLKGVLLAAKASFREWCAAGHGAANVGRTRDRRALLECWLGSPPSLLGFSAAPGVGDARARHAAEARQDRAAAVACYLDAVAFILAEEDPQEDDLVYIDPACRADVSRSAAALTALSETLGRPRSPAPDVKVYELCDANSVRLGELVLVFDNPAGGASGRFTLADGSALEVDWFGILAPDEIGISMYAPNQAGQGWLHGAIASDSSTISAAELELWGTTVRFETGVTARLTTEPARTASEARPLVGASPSPPASAGTLPLDELIARTGEETDWGI